MNGRLRLAVCLTRGTGAGAVREAGSWRLDAREVLPRRAVCFVAYWRAGAEPFSADSDVLALLAVVGATLPGEFVLIVTLMVISAFLFPVVVFREGPACDAATASSPFDAFLSSLSRFVHSFFNFFSKSVMGRGTDKVPCRTASKSRMRATDFTLEGWSP